MTLHTPDGWPPHFPRAEFLRSARAERLGIPNVPTPAHEANLRALAWHVLHPLRQAMGGPITISSGYRSPALNAATPGSSTTSQHSLGQAADLVPADGATFSTAAMFHWLLMNAPFDQLISEFPDGKGVPKWVHVSWRETSRRGMVLVATKVGGSVRYAPYK